MIGQGIKLTYKGTKMEQTFKQNFKQWNKTNSLAFIIPFNCNVDDKILDEFRGVINKNVPEESELGGSVDLEVN